MANISVRLNGLEADFESIENLPISITKQTDDLTQIGKSTGTTANNAINAFTLPATKRNCNIVSQAQMANTDKQYQNIFRLTVVIGGSVAFAGRAILTNMTNNGNFPKNFNFETLGDALDIWELLDAVSLRDLDLGTIEWTTQNIIDSQTGTYPTWKGIFAPVCYGNTSGETDPSPSYNGAMFMSRDFRFHIYYPAIIDAIFNSFGYTVESNFKELDFFKEWVYMFGVGDLLQTAQDITTTYLRATRSTDYTLPNAGFANVRFNTISDPQSGWDGVNYWWVAPVTGTYKVQFGLNFDALNEWRLTIDEPAATPNIYGIIGGTEYVHTPAPSFLATEIEVKVYAGTRIYVEVRPVNPTYTIFAQNTYLNIQLVNELFVGTTIDIASCLHDRPLKDFLKGISHQFNLMWFVNQTLKKVYFEPRFDYQLPDVFGVLQTYAGWYSAPANQDPLVLKLDQDTIQLQVFDPYGKFLRLSYKEGDDPAGQYYLKFVSESDILPYGIQADFTDRGKDGTVSENPFFENMYLGFSNTVSTFEFALPFVLPSSTDMDEVFQSDNFGRVLGTLPDPTYESEPKCAWVYRGKTFVRHQDTIAPWGSGSIGAYALLMQANTLSFNTQYIVTEFENGSYCKTLRFLRGGEQNPSVTQGIELDGLARYFYYTYFAIINEGIKLIAEAQIKTPQLASEDFSGLRRLWLNGKTVLAVLSKITDFKPSLAENTKVELVKYVEMTQDFADNNIEHRDLQQAPFNHVNYDAIVI